MADWGTFAALVGVVCVLLLVLSQLTEQALTPVDADSSDRDESRPPAESPAPPAGSRADGDASADARRSRTGRPIEREDPTRRVDPTEAGFDDDGTKAEPPRSHADDSPLDHADGSEPVRRSERGGSVAAHVDGQPVTTGALLANVAITQGLFAALVIGAAIYTGIPAEALGIAFTSAYLETGLLVGLAAGIGLYAANEVGAALARRYGIDHSEELREMLAPESVGGWLILLLAVLPLIAIFEELLFRAALIGAMEAGFGVSPWVLAVGSSILFALGHGIQGTAGIVVTGLLGFVLATLFVVTGSLLVVIVAHYVINALEFVVHEGLEVEWARTIES